MYQSSYYPERRARIRRRIAKRCILHLGAAGSIEGMLRELDAGGARVKITPRNMTLAGKLHLETSSDDHGTFSVVWQIGQQVGLQAVTG